MKVFYNVQKKSLAKNKSFKATVQDLCTALFSKTVLYHFYDKSPLYLEVHIK